MSQGLFKVSKMIEDEITRLDRERNSIEDLLMREAPDVDEMLCDRYLYQYQFINARIHEMQVFSDLFHMEFYQDLKEASEVEGEINQ